MVVVESSQLEFYSRNDDWLEAVWDIRYRGGQNYDLLPSTYTSTFDLYLYLRPKALPSTQQVDNQAFVFKKGMVERSMITTFNLWKG